uniref:Uncharacterized protein n=1 Tax=Oncorhynchus mykiss TaxID=8022 RepID=A0A8C7RBM0_ONCMY
MPTSTNQEYCSRPPLHNILQLLFLTGEWEGHAPHKMSQANDITEARLSRPSLMLKPLENKKYLFADHSCHFLLDNIAGMPRLYELIKLRNQEGKGDPMKSLLNLMIVLKFNMFTHHFFRGEVKFHVMFLDRQRAGLIMVSDPPFGGLVKPLRKLQTSNSLLRGTGTHTNLTPPDIILPKAEGYRLSVLSLFFQDGKQGKYSWRHCQPCGRCAPPGTTPVGTAQVWKAATTGSLKHKRRACPLKDRGPVRSEFTVLHIPRLSTQRNTEMDRQGWHQTTVCSQLYPCQYSLVTHPKWRVSLRVCADCVCLCECV